MLFNSIEFIFVFLPITLTAYFLLNKYRLVLPAKLVLLVASLFFYSYWNPIYLPLLLVSMLVNFYLALNLGKNRTRFFSEKSLLLLGIIFNLGLLGYFKYVDFFIDNFNSIFDSNVPFTHVLLPLGISFFTFTQIAYLVDAYKGKVKENSILNYMLFITFFPQLIAGPIVHHKEMMPQFFSKFRLLVNYKNLALGLLIFSVGLFKKVVIADTFALWADAGFSRSAELSLLEAWVASLSYTFQLYFDFSGYTDMAMGLALMFNIRLPLNFDSPLKATSIRAFWRAWHITLGRFLRDYIYIPLGGSKTGVLATSFNVIITFLIGGIWHGAAWTFVIWGLMHGMALAAQQMWNKLGFQLNAILGWLLTFCFINTTFVVFRADSFQQAKNIIGSMFGITNRSANNDFYWIEHILSTLNILRLPGEISFLIAAKFPLFFLCIGFLIVLGLRNSNTILSLDNFKLRHLLFITLSLLCFVFSTSSSENSPFLYFNF